VTAPNATRRRDDGFALVESLASLVVVGMISLLIIDGLGAGRRAWERVDAREATIEVIEGAQQTLRDRLEQTFPTTLYDTNPPSIDFLGGRDTLTFIANPPESARPSALRRYSLGLDTAGELVLASVSDVDPMVTSLARRQVLIRGVRALDIAYFGPAPPDNAPAWREAWTGQPLPPQLIRIRLVFEPGDPRPWPDLMIRPRITIDNACLLNITNHKCRGRV
jgi:general secretion pathway protein J